MNIRLETKRLIVRNIEGKDIDKVCEICKDEDVLVNLGLDTLMDDFDIKNRIVNRCKDNKEIWLVYELKENCEIIGYCSMACWPINRYGVEYVVKKEYRNKGYNVEALEVILDKIDKEEYICEFVAGSFIENVGSIKCLEKLGFDRSDNIIKVRTDKGIKPGYYYSRASKYR